MSTKNYKTGVMLELFWGYSGEALGFVGDCFGLGYLGNAGEEVFEVKCGHQEL